MRKSANDERVCSLPDLGVVSLETYSPKGNGLLQIQHCTSAGWPQSVSLTLALQLADVTMPRALAGMTEDQRLERRVQLEMSGSASCARDLKESVSK